ncbi:hypothetical protein FOZ61_000641 [Perkinsus olseni]|uniref:Uncharacterized protein n=1 Tax=Perkinsus olseni TaxID=32597 RepID=A0A7J6LZD0_PEROL|nr:hypothetical protein FOZ61_000641 [Perkinsus olseni]KAF4670973.1 hypothetical protein FOL46_000539 [Perkinsus olseni]
MIFIINMIAAIAATVVVGGTTIPNTTSPPSPDLPSGPTEHEIWWMLAENKIAELLEAEPKATTGLFDGVELHPMPTTVGPFTSTTTTSTTSRPEGQLRGGAGSSTSASWRQEVGVVLVAIVVEIATLATM